MSAILSESQLNDFITPSVACIKPVETLPTQNTTDPNSNPYEVTTEDAVARTNPAPAQISLTDCLACSGCVTSAEAVLISLQSHEEVLRTLEQYESLSVDEAIAGKEGRLFVASVSPQVRASLAATFGVSSRDAGKIIEQLLCGEAGLRGGVEKKSGFQWCVDTNRIRDVVLHGTVEEALSASHTGHDRQPKRPILASACPGWICYAEKSQPHVLPHLSRLKSPQALAGTLIKSVLARKFGVAPERIWHLAVMPCFDKKLEASREELTDAWWQDQDVEMNGDVRVDGQERNSGIRDVDCVITARELLMLAEAKGISLPQLPRRSVKMDAFPDTMLDAFLFRKSRRQRFQEQDAGPSGGFSYQILRSMQRRHAGSQLKTQRGRNLDVVEYSLVSSDGQTLGKTARYYGFKNIQNLVRKLQPARPSKLLGGARRPQGGGTSGTGLQNYSYVEVMACPGGCTNGGGQVKVGDLVENSLVEGSTEKAEQIRSENATRKPSLAEQKQWLARVDEAYYSAESDSDEDVIQPAINCDRADSMDIDTPDVDAKSVLRHWSSLTGLPVEKLVYTSFRAVESDVGKEKNKASTDVERVAGLASSVGGGW